ncbi:hypothetical protein LNKW23_47630 [Paralimibaculum aggregatum]|uniref:Knr4/Smi1-like domain-containing protein n=1 Tax=Paralimibaculum aggregatum TaxID=3036245 RepID=A0ABQ6LTW8_9RHOB|nr:SMI1/KNR4 family protein [Limibaculum sp. NKW23]GMG85540.1 hypothetical protein LNKW23_47630 [Limibaculum sp. NKW23]
MIEIEWMSYLSGRPAPTEDDLAQLERHTGLELPEDYRRVVRQHAGQAPRHGRVSFGEGAQGGSTFVALFFVSTEREFLFDPDNVFGALRSFRDWADGQPWAERMLPIGSNSAAGVFCLDYREVGPPKMTFADKYEDPDYDKALLPVADSFGDLLAKLS